VVVLVAGGNGQLGQALRFVAQEYPEIQFHFCSSDQLNITDIDSVAAVFETLKPNFCINAAAYTAVDKAETDIENARVINVTGSINLAKACNQYATTLIHISTDFVFDGNKNKPYTEEDATNPQGIYGLTKREGELEIAAIANAYFIIRTSWLYSEFGNNFMKTMLRLAKERTALSVVSDQIGTPTHALDLAEMIVKVILSKSKNYGIYHFSNEGSASWFDFANKIFEANNVKITLSPITTEEYPTPAKRPKYSVLDKTKIKTEFKTTIKSWEEALLRK
jgi:dTDP-4-dehydrorhamnose reductase